METNTKILPSLKHGFKDLTGNRFGRLLVLSFSHRAKNSSWFLCKCDCGKQKIIRTSSLTTGITKSCGCIVVERGKKILRQFRKHGESWPIVTPEYRTWDSMLGRCLNKNNKGYKYYGGRGITVCQRWIDSYDAFLHDMGRKPSQNHSIDRIKNDKGYYPENCRWATKKEQSNNRRSNTLLTFNGVTLTISQWSDRVNIPYETLVRRSMKGWSHKDILTRKLKKDYRRDGTTN